MDLNYGVESGDPGWDDEQMTERPVRLNVDLAALRRAFPEPQPSQLGQKIQQIGLAAAPIIQRSFDAAFAALNRLRR